jgi:hypothetical protein
MKVLSLSWLGMRTKNFATMSAFFEKALGLQKFEISHKMKSRTPHHHATTREYTVMTVSLNFSAVST